MARTCMRHMIWKKATVSFTHNEATNSGKDNVWLFGVWILEFLLFFSHAGSKSLFLSQTHLCFIVFLFMEMMYYQIYKTILKICTLCCCSVESPDILSQSTLLIWDNQRTGEQLVRRPWQPKSKLHLWACSGANTESFLMRTRAICSCPLNNLYMDVGCWFVQRPAFVFTGHSGDFLIHIVVWTICQCGWNVSTFQGLGITLIFWRHFSTLLLAIWPYGVMKSILNLNLGI